MDVHGATGEWTELGVLTVNTSSDWPPDSPVTLEQLRTDGVTLIPDASNTMGSTTNERSVLLRGTLGSAMAGRKVRLHVELKPNSEAFEGIASATGEWALPGVVSTVELSLADLLDQDLHWQAWQEDTNGNVSQPIAFDSGSPIDLSQTELLAGTPEIPEQAEQYIYLGWVPLPVGTTMKISRNLHFQALLAEEASSSPGDTLRLQVEVQPISYPFAGIPSATGKAVLDGEAASVSIQGFTDLVDYHWQCRTIDSSGKVSEWVQYAKPAQGADSDVADPVTGEAADVDFRVDTTGCSASKALSQMEKSSLWVLGFLSLFVLLATIRRR
jgi:hypothetical protein